MGSLAGFVEESGARGGRLKLFGAGWLAKVAIGSAGPRRRGKGEAAHTFLALCQTQQRVSERFCCPLRKSCGTKRSQPSEQTMRKEMITPQASIRIPSRRLVLFLARLDRVR